MIEVTQARFAIALLLVGGLVACGGSEGGSSGASGGSNAASSSNARPAAGALAPDAEAQQIFATRCSVCHGQDGRGDGPGSAALDPKPRNYHDEEWQERTTDEEIRQAILYGGAAVGKSPSMVANPDLTSKPEVVAALTQLIRRFGEEN
jgi:mono/diheme cytochrome c family protein